MLTVISLVNDTATYQHNVLGSMRGQMIPVLNAPTAAVGLNFGLSQATHEIVVLCHQDVIFPPGWELLLTDQISRINDAEFGVLGTFGMDLDCHFAGNVRDPHGNPKLGTLPCKAMTVDEHCMIIRKSSGLRFDENLLGFHLYGADICLTAAAKGMKNYIIDAPLIHLSGGKIDRLFKECAEEFKRKWQNRSPYKKVATTCGMFMLN